MPAIHLTTFIQAPIQRVFDLSRSINLHKKSFERSGEVAIAGVTSGLIRLNETVTWQAKHLGKKRIMKMKISAMESPVHFTDEMTEGDFTVMKHEHHFKQVENGTIMIDQFYFESPYGIIGKVVNQFYLTRYLRRLLERRNLTIKEYAESNKWQHLL
ncbi:MAG: SRPBCC family protein [Chitinophagaceae bacterium]|nr:SRPBCC family protein [Chitinophagaceae bacterium]